MRLVLLKIPINLTAYSLEVILKAFLMVACQSNLDKRHNGYLVLRSLTKQVFVKSGVNPIPYSFNPFFNHLLSIKL